MLSLHCFTDTVTPAETYLAPVPETTEWTWPSLRHSAECVVSGSGAGGLNKHTMQQVSVIVKHLYSNEYFFKHCKIAKARKWLNLLCMIKYVVFFTTIYIPFLHYHLISQKIKQKFCCCNILQKSYKMQKLTCAKKKFTDFLRFCKVCNKWRKLDIH